MLTGNRGCGWDAKLARVKTIWVVVTDSTVDSGGTSACLLYQIPHSPSHRLLADRLSHQHGCRQVRDDHLAGKDRHTLGTRCIGWAARLAPQQN